MPWIYTRSPKDTNDYILDDIEKNRSAAFGLLSWADICTTRGSGPHVPDPKTLRREAAHDRSKQITLGHNWFSVRKPEGSGKKERGTS